MEQDYQKLLSYTNISLTDRASINRIYFSEAEIEINRKIISNFTLKEVQNYLTLAKMIRDGYFVISAPNSLIFERCLGFYFSLTELGKTQINFIKGL